MHTIIKAFGNNNTVDHIRIRTNINVNNWQGRAKNG